MSEETSNKGALSFIISIILLISSLVELGLALPLVGFVLLGFIVFSACFVFGQIQTDSKNLFSYLLAAALYLAVTVPLAATPAMVLLLGATGGVITTASVAFAASGFGALAVVLAVGIYFGCKKLSSVISGYQAHQKLQPVASEGFNVDPNKQESNDWNVTLLNEPVPEDTVEQELGKGDKNSHSP